MSLFKKRKPAVNRSKPRSTTATRYASRRSRRTRTPQRARRASARYR